MRCSRPLRDHKGLIFGCLFISCELAKGLLNRYTVKQPYRGFESPSLRQSQSWATLFILPRNGTPPSFLPLFDAVGLCVGFLYAASRAVAKVDFCRLCRAAPKVVGKVVNIPSSAIA